jgi:hypothetical protein
MSYIIKQDSMAEGHSIQSGVPMKALHPTTNRWIEVEGHTVKQITDEMELEDLPEGTKWSAKVDGKLVHSGTISGEIVEIVSYNPDNDTETVQSDDSSPVPESSGDN